MSVEDKDEGRGCSRDVINASAAIALNGGTQQALLTHLLHETRIEMLVAVGLRV